MKGIVLAGGSGSRLYPVTKVMSKQLMPIYNKPMVYYPLSVLMLAGIKEILLISTPEDIGHFKKLLGEGKHLGIHIQYAVQEQPKGLSQAFLIGENFIGKDAVALVLGDNIFYGNGFSKIVQSAAQLKSGAKIFGYYVEDPQRYGVAEIGDHLEVLGIEEKPDNPKSNYAVTGLYFYDNSVIERAKALKPSQRGELEITDLNNSYLEDNSLSITVMSRGMAWLDTGTHSSLLEASNFIATLEKQQGLQVACIEEIAYKMNYINHSQLLSLALDQGNSTYGAYLKKIAGEK